MTTAKQLTMGAKKKNPSPQKRPAVSTLPKNKNGKAGRVAQSIREPASTQGERAAGMENIRIMPAKREPLPTRTDFDHGYIPLDGKQRRARRGLLRQWAMTPDPFIAERLRWQDHRREQVELPYVEQLRFIFGKPMDWRTVICIEAKHDSDSRQELADWLAGSAIENDADELAAFAKILTEIQKAKEPGPYVKTKVVALLFVLRCFDAGVMPTKAQVREFLRAKKIRLPERNNEWRDLFDGPILGHLPQAQAGGRKNRSSSSQNH